MCTNIVEHAVVAGSAKGSHGWFRVECAHVSYDHPFHAPLDHALNIDFVDTAGGIGERIGVELTVESGRELANAILAVVDQAEAFERSSRAVTA
jgi:hypothetical protein